MDYEERWERWGLKATKGDVPFMVTDTEAKMNKFGRLMEEVGGSEHMYCIDHDLQCIASVVFGADFYGSDGTLSRIIRFRVLWQ